MEDFRQSIMMAWICQRI